jgi:hypothetical protein
MVRISTSENVPVSPSIDNSNPKALYNSTTTAYPTSLVQLLSRDRSYELDRDFCVMQTCDLFYSPYQSSPALTRSTTSRLISTTVPNNMLPIPEHRRGSERLKQLRFYGPDGKLQVLRDGVSDARVRSRVFESRS